MIDLGPDGADAPNVARNGRQCLNVAREATNDIGARGVGLQQRALGGEPAAAALFEGDDSLSTYVDFAAGGPDSVRALARGASLTPEACVRRSLPLTALSAAAVGGLVGGKLGQTAPDATPDRVTTR